MGPITLIALVNVVFWLQKRYFSKEDQLGRV